MIKITKINNEKLILNSALIETIELIPDTKITLTNGRYYLVKETTQEIIDAIIQFEKQKLIINRLKNEV